MNPINLDTYSLSLLTAKEDILNDRSSTNWAVFTYEKHWNLKLADSGAGGLDDLIKKLSSRSIQYGLCRVMDPNTQTPRIILIHWVGEQVNESQREICKEHLPAIKVFFRDANVLISACRVEDLSQEKVMETLNKIAQPGRVPRKSYVPGSHQVVGTNYRKTNPAIEMKFSKRESFWERSEREEERRKEEERIRLLEARIAWEKQRVQRERDEEEERERRIREKERLVEEQRKEQARLEAEHRRIEKARWVQQQKEYEEEIKGKYRRSQSIEMAAEAAALISSRSMHPREFFQQQERSVSHSFSPPSTPNSPSRSTPSFLHRPAFRYQRSLTESVLSHSPHSPSYIPNFQKSDSENSPSPTPKPLSPAFIFSKSALPVTSPKLDSLPSFIPPPMVPARGGSLQNKFFSPSYATNITSSRAFPKETTLKTEHVSLEGSQPLNTLRNDVLPQDAPSHQLPPRKTAEVSDVDILLSSDTYKAELVPINAEAKPLHTPKPPVWAERVDVICHDILPKNIHNVSHISETSNYTTSSTRESTLYATSTPTKTKSIPTEDSHIAELTHSADLSTTKTVHPTTDPGIHIAPHTTEDLLAPVPPVIEDTCPIAQATTQTPLLPISPTTNAKLTPILQMSESTLHPVPPTSNTTLNTSLSIKKAAIITSANITEAIFSPLNTSAKLSSASPIKEATLPAPPQKTGATLPAPPPTTEPTLPDPSPTTEPTLPAPPPTTEATLPAPPLTTEAILIAPPLTTEATFIAPPSTEATLSALLPTAEATLHALPRTTEATLPAPPPTTEATLAASPQTKEATLAASPQTKESTLTAPPPTEVTLTAPPPKAQAALPAPSLTSETTLPAHPPTTEATFPAPSLTTKATLPAPPPTFSPVAEAKHDLVSPSTTLSLLNFVSPLPYTPFSLESKHLVKSPAVQEKKAISSLLDESPSALVHITSTVRTITSVTGPLASPPMDTPSTPFSDTLTIPPTVTSSAPTTYTTLQQQDQLPDTPYETQCLITDNRLDAPPTDSFLICKAPPTGKTPPTGEIGNLPSDSSFTYQVPPTSSILITGTPPTDQIPPLVSSPICEALSTENILVTGTPLFHTSATNEAQPTDNILLIETSPRDISLPPESSPIDEIVLTETPLIGTSSAYEAPPTDNTTVTETLPNDTLFTYEAPPTDNTTVTETLPSDISFTYGAPPTDNTTVTETLPSDISFTYGAPPTDNTTVTETLPSGISFTYEAPPTDNTTVTETLPSDISFTCGAPPIDNILLTETPPTSEAHPTENILLIEALTNDVSTSEIPTTNSRCLIENMPTDVSFPSETFPIGSSFLFQTAPTGSSSTLETSPTDNILPFNTPLTESPFKSEHPPTYYSNLLENPPLSEISSTGNVLLPDVPFNNITLLYEAAPTEDLLRFEAKPTANSFQFGVAQTEVPLWPLDHKQSRNLQTPDPRPEMEIISKTSTIEYHRSTMTSGIMEHSVELKEPLPLLKSFHLNSNEVVDSSLPVENPCASSALDC